MVTRILVLAFGALASFGTAQQQFESWKPLGCSSASVGNVIGQQTIQFNSYLACERECTSVNAPFMALNFQSCVCGTEQPSSSDFVSQKECTQTCPGFPANSCGNVNGQKLWMVLSTGVGGGSSSNGTDGGSSASSHSATSSAPSTTMTTKIVPSVVTLGNTVVKTVNAGSTSSPSQSSSSSSGGGSKVGIAVGVVVAVLVVAAIIGGTFFYLRQRRRKEIEKEHRRQSAMNAFANAPKAPNMSVLPANDSRLDPIIAARRQSDGSIADNIDFSRRVLKVTNPDDRW